MCGHCNISSKNNHTVAFSRHAMIYFILLFCKTWLSMGLRHQQNYTVCNVKDLIKPNIDSIVCFISPQS